jgi:hypothetical protein
MEKETPFDIDRFFQQPDLTTASDADIAKALTVLCSRPVFNLGTQHREINRCVLLTALKNARFIERVENSNAALQKRVLLWAVVATVAAILQALVGVAQLFKP